MTKSSWIITLAMAAAIAVFWWAGGLPSERPEPSVSPPEMEKQSASKPKKPGPNTVMLPEEAPSERIVTSVTPGAVMATSVPTGAPVGETVSGTATVKSPGALDSDAAKGKTSEQKSDLPELAVKMEAAKIEAEAVALNIRQYSLRFGGNPVGSNAEIVKELDGGNPKNARYLPSELKRLNDQGELIDSWGTPYFFHQLSAKQLEVRSAGPDRKMWSSDDIFQK